jgi:hypothetical protein
MLTRSSQARRLLIVLAALVVAACGPPPSATASTVVDSDCGSDGPYTETIASKATPTPAAAGGGLFLELGVRRLQVDVGPIREARYTFPIPAGVGRVIGVSFNDANPNTWAVRGTELLVTFKGPNGGWLVNDFPRFTIIVLLAPTLRPGDTVTWQPYRRFEQEFVSVDRPLACTVRDPAQILQTVTVRA